ncbi:phosphate ABC transporter substrate-binding protein, PhoT family [Ferrimonas balearica DSM 9799]|uniref:Phosphate-binding protein n=1 Tax=Ferrimonas balearica (strain DSM 9799 / CCM 4581 / KCTC 23876 / PAT) TaxID=550540 RepID=E1SS67_FERBD|nr:phosphate ABC transporter substrate-binding protein PstS family protein [Ferrimonas balearica]ADN76999.1 phosphate ABC transporter substrate-binding protein, PhoT family [Ferrimonas balearica DSM 9799]MBW3140007.1 phosphate ABC transporter substrate-binding protein PstS family protein [Ferrimonas balearica]MBW3165031.1 phosphate ABC transporter substrate-binding protein PstS family protein [Ferrimonas balearica]MBY5980102.1 phosphate ABC transporter substrate-binding protein PstS family prot
MRIKHLVGALSLAVASVFSASAAAAIDPTLPEYQKTSGVSGNLSSVGSDTLANMMTLWAEEFRKQYPNINPQIQAAGSSTAPPALTEGTSQFGPMSRKMKPNEEEAFVKRYGYKPTAIRVAIDALAVFAHKDNPIQGLTIEQVDGIFSSTLKCGGDAVRRWGDLGLTGSWANRDIQLYGRNSVSGTYGYFKKKALCKGDFKPNVNEQPGSASVVQSVSTSLNAIGYSGIGYKTAGVRAVPLAKSGSDFVEATAANAANGQYPLSRYLYVYVNKHPNRPLDPMVAEFVKFMLSRQGQMVVEKDGYVPLPRAVIAKDLAQLGIQL